MSKITPAATEAVLAPETEKVFLHLLTIETSAGTVLRCVDNNQNVTSRGDEFFGVGFTIILPEQTDNAPRACRLAIDNTDLAIYTAIKQAVEQDINVSVCVIMAHTPDVYERGPLKYRLRNVKANKESISGELYDFYLLERRFPKDTYSPDDFEGLFY